MANRKRIGEIFDLNDDTAMFYITMPERMDKNSYIIKQNIIAGAEVLGWFLPSDDTGRTLDNRWFALNTVHSAKYGFGYFLWRSAYIVISDVTAYKCEAGIMSYHYINYIFAYRLVVSDSRNGIVLNTGKEAQEHYIQIEDCYIAGLSLPDYTYQPSECTKIVGLRMPVYTTASKFFPVKPHTAWYGVAAEGAWDGISRFGSSTLANFKNTAQCGSNAAIATQEGASDKTPVMHTYKLKLETVAANALVFIHQPMPGWINLDDCGDRQCTGLYNVLLRDTDGSLTGTAASVMSNNEGVNKKGKCRAQPENNPFICESQEYAMLQWENRDDDGLTRLLSLSLLLRRI
jgi:hypothetical protein